MVGNKDYFLGLQINFDSALKMSACNKVLKPLRCLNQMNFDFFQPLSSSRGDVFILKNFQFSWECVWAELLLRQWSCAPLQKDGWCSSICSQGGMRLSARNKG